MYKFFASFFRFWSYAHLTLFLIILFGKKNPEPKFYFLNVYAIISNLSTFMIFLYFKVPQIFRNLHSENILIQNESYNLINLNRELYLKNFLVEIYGKNFTQKDLELNFDEIKTLCKQYLENDWKTIVKVYFIFYFCITISLYFYLFILET